MVDGQTVVEFCGLEVEPMYHESDHIHVTALTQLTGVPVQVNIILPNWLGPFVDIYSFRLNIAYLEIGWITGIYFSLVTISLNIILQVK